MIFTFFILEANTHPLFIKFKDAPSWVFINDKKNHNSVSSEPVKDGISVENQLKNAIDNAKMELSRKMRSIIIKDVNLSLLRNEDNTINTKDYYEIKTLFTNLFLSCNVEKKWTAPDGEIFVLVSFNIESLDIPYIISSQYTVGLVTIRNSKKVNKHTEYISIISRELEQVVFNVKEYNQEIQSKIGDVVVGIADYMPGSFFLQSELALAHGRYLLGKQDQGERSMFKTKIVAKKINENGTLFVYMIKE